MALTRPFDTPRPPDYAEIPQPLGIGTLKLADGALVQGFVCEAIAVDGARDISSFGGWRNFVLNR